MAACVALTALLPPAGPVGLEVAMLIGGWTLRREKRVGRARLLSVTLADVGPLSQDAFGVEMAML